MTMKKRDLKTQSLTDWKRIDSMRDEDIDLSDIPELNDNFLRMPNWFFRNLKLS